MTRRVNDIIHTIDEPNTPLRNQRVTIIRILERGYYCQNAQGREGFIVERHITSGASVAKQSNQREEGLPLSEAGRLTDMTVEQLRPLLWDGRLKGYKDANGWWRTTVADIEHYKAEAAKLKSGHAWRQGRFKNKGNIE